MYFCVVVLFVGRHTEICKLNFFSCSKTASEAGAGSARASPRPAFSGTATTAGETLQLLSFLRSCLYFDVYLVLKSSLVRR
jgi:hypothetical protein